MKWMSRPSIPVVNCGSALSLASIRRQSCSVAQYCASFCMVASCTPCEASVTVSLSGHFAATMRRRRSTSCSCGTLTRKGRMAVFSLVAMGEAPDLDGWLGEVSAATAGCVRSRPRAPAAAEVAITLRRVGQSDRARMLFASVQVRA
jgi:hypothetical protein